MTPDPKMPLPDSPAERLTPSISIGYASGNFGKSIVWNTSELFLIFYLTDLIGLDAIQAGLIVFASLVWDALLAPCVGLLADRTSSTIGRYGPFILVGAPLCAFSFAMIFTLPSAIPEHAALLTLLTLLLFRTAYALVDLPHNALITQVSKTSSGRSHLATLRYLFSSLAVMVIAFASYFVMAPDALVEQEARFRLFGISVALIAGIVVVGSWWSVRRYDRQPFQAPVAFVPQVKNSLRIFADQDARAVVLYAFFSGLLISIFGKSLNYFAKYQLGDEALVALGLFAMMIGQIVGAIVWGRISQKIQKVSAVRYAGLLLAPAALLFFLFAHLGLVPFVLFSLAIGLCTGGIYALIWSIAPDIIDKIDAITGLRPEAIYFGILIVTIKLGMGIGAFLLGGALDAIGYVANFEQSEITLIGLRLLMTISPIVGGLSTAFVLVQCKLSHADHAEYRRILDERSSASQLPG
jgi:glycoside/pentoside/hexuronide:cation symporter, GPH family